MKLPPFFCTSSSDETRPSRARTQQSARWLFLRLVVSALLCLSLLTNSTLVARLPPGIGGVQVAHAAGPFTVNSTADEVDANIGNSQCVTASGTCTLRAAIQEANVSGGATINLPSGIYALTLTGANEETAATGDLDIIGNITIVGTDTTATTIIDGNNSDRVFEVFGSATLTIIGVMIQHGGNSAGGILMHDTASLTLKNSTLANNNGGGLNNLSSSNNINIINSTISSNNSTISGGIYTQGGTIRLRNVTITANSGSLSGGGLSNNGGAVFLKNSILAGNLGPGSSPDCSGPIDSQGYNIVGDNTGCTFSPSGNDQVGTGASPVLPHLDPLANNGGRAFTQALQLDSPAINAGDNATGCTDTSGTVLTDDQRGTIRPQGGRCDIGAYEVPVVKFINSTYTVNEVGPTAAITATLEGASAYTVTVPYTTTDGTAIAGSDYLTATGALTFAPFDTTGAFTVPIINDPLFEGNETVNLTLGNPGSAMLGSPSTAVLTIVDNDPPPNMVFSSNAYTVTEGTGAGTTTPTITVTLTSAAGRPITVTYGTSNGTALAGSDYMAVTSTVTFNPGDTAKTFNVPTTRDAIDEPDETLNLALSNPVSATLGLTSTATLTILDDDPPPTVGFSSGAYSVSEGIGTATITVSLTPASGRPVTVTYGTSSGTALAGSDYTAVTSTLTFNPGDISKTFGVPITQDQTIEPSETLTLTLSNKINATLGTNPAILTILDDDHPPVFFTYLPLIMRNFPAPFTGFEVEPNNRTIDANGPLGSGLAVNGYPQDFRDYFYFNSGAGTITLDLTNYTGPGQLQLYYQVVDVAHLVRYDPTPPYSIKVADQPAGRYYLIVYTAIPIPSTTSAYTLVGTFP